MITTQVEVYEKSMKNVSPPIGCHGNGGHLGFSKLLLTHSFFYTINIFFFFKGHEFVAKHIWKLKEIL